MDDLISLLTKRKPPLIHATLHNHSQGTLICVSLVLSDQECFSVGYTRQEDTPPAKVMLQYKKLSHLDSLQRFFSIYLTLGTQRTSNYGVACRRRLRGRRPWSSDHENGPANTASFGLPHESRTQTSWSQDPLAGPFPSQHLLQ